MKMANSTLLSFFILLLATSTQQSQYPLPQNGIYQGNTVGLNGMLNNGQIPYTGPVGNLNYQQPLVPQPAGNLNYQQPLVPQPAGNPYYQQQVPQVPYMPWNLNQMQNTGLLGTFVAIPGGYSLLKYGQPIYPPLCYEQNRRNNGVNFSDKLIGKRAFTHKLTRTYLCTDKYNTQFYLIINSIDTLTGSGSLTEDKYVETYYNMAGQEGFWTPW